MSAAVRPTVVGRRQRLSDVIASELIRAQTVPSTLWLLGLGFAVGVFFAVLGDTDPSARVDVVSISVKVSLTTSAIAVFSVLLVTDEFSRRTLITSVAAVPNRRRLLVAKLVVAALFAIVLSLAALLVSAMVLGITRGGFVPLGDGGALAAVGVVVKGVFVAVFSVLFGACVRSSTLGVVLVLAIVFLVPVLSFPIGDTGIALNEYALVAAAGVLVPFRSELVGISVVALVIWIGGPAVIGPRLFIRNEV